MNNIFKIITIAAMSIFLNTNASFAGKGHDHEEHQHEEHQEKSHENHDKHDHKDEKKEAHEHESNEQESHHEHDHEEDSHDEHGDEDEHNHESDSHDDHGHGDHHDGEHHDEDISNIWAKFHIFPKDVNKIVKGDAIAIKNISDGKIIESKIKLIFPTADELSQTIIAIAEIDNKEGAWKPGMVVEGIVKNNSKQASVIVKNSAIQNMEGKDVVFVKEGSSYEAKEITKGKSSSQYTEITNGLELGQKYVEEGSFIIKADIQKSAAAHDH